MRRRAHESLFLGAFSGALLLHGGNPWTAFHDLLIGRLIPSLAAPNPAPFVEHDDPQAAVAERLGREQSAHAVGLAFAPLELNSSDAQFDFNLTPERYTIQACIV